VATDASEVGGDEHVGNEIGVRLGDSGGGKHGSNKLCDAVHFRSHCTFGKR